MNKQFSSLPKRNIEVSGKGVAEYLGLSIEVICRMQHCSLIRYRERQLIVNTEDLYFGKSQKCAAQCAA